MLIAALCALACGAVAGIFLAFRHFVHKRLPVWVALAHGVGGATGFTLVLLTVVQQPGFALARQALYLFIVTIALGCVNLLFHVRKVRHRTSLILMHALCAVSGVLTLIYALATHAPETEAVAATQAAPPALPAPSAPAVASVEAGPAPAASNAAPSAPAPSVPSSGAPSPAAAGPNADPAAVPGGEFALDPAVREALGNSFTFASNSALLATSSMPALTAIATALKDHPEVTLIEVQGHADGRGADGHNVGLTKARATAVMEALVALGVDRSRLRAAGYGARCPADPGCRQSEPPSGCLETAKLKADRRVVFVPLRVGGASFSGEVACERGADLIPPDDKEFQGGKR